MRGLAYDAAAGPERIALSLGNVRVRVKPGRIPRGFHVGLLECGFRMPFELASSYEPRGDQAAAIEQLVRGVRDGDPHQVLLGVTGSGKTFTMAKVVEAVDRPTLVLAHNKTLAA